MALNKQQVSVNFQKGLDTKSDPWQVPIGNFLELENSIFTKQGLLQKRNGFKQIATINDSSVSSLTIYNNELTAVGQSLYAYNQPNEEFINKGTFYPVKVNTKQLIANSSDLHQIDAITSPNGLTCVVWWESINPNIHNLKYAVFDATSGQSLINATDIVPSAGTVSGTPKVFYFNNNFVVIFPANSAGQKLEFFTINCLTLAVSASQVFAPSYIPNPNIPFYQVSLTGLSWDAVIAQNKIFVGYNVGANGFYVTIINPDFSSPVPTQIDNSVNASCVGAMTDGVNAYFAYTNNHVAPGPVSIGNIVGVQALSGTVSTLWAPQAFFNEGTYISNITGSIVGSTITVISEYVQQYNYFPYSYGYVGNNQIYKRTCTTAGVVGAAPTSPFLKGVGLASKSFVVNNDIYFASTYSFGNGLTTNTVNTNQPCYFVHDINGKVVTQLQYRNGAGYYALGGLPNVTANQFTGNASINSNKITSITDTSTLYVGQKLVSPNFPEADLYIESIDSVSSVTVSRTANSTGPTVLYDTKISFPYLYQAIANSFGGNESGESLIFGLRGAKLAEIEFYKQQIKTVEAGANLNLASGFLWNYDGVSATENNFFIYPDSLYVQGIPNQRINATTNSGSPLVSIADTSYIKVGQFVSGTGISFGVTYTKTCNTTTGSQIITVNNTTNLSVGQLVSGAGIPALSTITAIQTGTTIIISSPATATAAGVTLSFGGGATVVAIISSTVFAVDIAATSSGTNFLTFFGKMQTGNYQYAAVYQYTDNRGNLIQSSPSIPFFFEVKPAATISATTDGTNILKSISSDDFAKLQVGQSVSGTNIGSGSYITYLDSSVPSNLQATLSQITGGAGVSTVTVSQISQASVFVPNLRITYKNSVNIAIFRALTATGSVFEQLTSPRTPVENDPTQDYTNYVDLQSSLQIQGNNILYTTGGVLDNTATPFCYDVVVFDGRLWLISENKAYYSKPLVESTPVEMSDLQTLYVQPLQNYQGTTGSLTALSVMDDKLILFKKNAIYYVNGNGPDATGANSQYSEPILITATVGTDNLFSISYNPLGIIFQTDKGIWILGRDLSTSYFGAPVESFTQSAIVTSANLIPGTNQSRFCLSSGITLMYDYFYGQWGSFKGIPNLSSTIYNEKHTFIDKYGRIAQETPNYYIDISNPVLMKFTTSWFAIAGLQGFERAYFLFLLGKYYSPHKLNVELAYDFNDGYTQNTVITPENFASVYGADPYFGSSEFFGGPSQVEKWRIMLTKQKCDSVQVRISEVFDPSYGVQAGAGLTLSGMNFIIGVKKGYGPISQFNTAG
jgi:hypothetical protein